MTPDADDVPEPRPVAVVPANGPSGQSAERAPDRPLAGYPYEGEPCEEADCGIEGVDETAECAAYTTASGQTVYGCEETPPRGIGGCTKMTFYTEAGEPYADMNSCAGEGFEAPPEPPSGEFEYWEAPKPPRDYGEPGGETDWCAPAGPGEKHCGLDGIPKGWSCGIFYGTVHGTVRACAPEASFYDAYYDGSSPFACSAKLRVYDESGRVVDTYDSCPEIRRQDCGPDQCGVAKARENWYCRSERYAYGGLYDGERETFVRCAHPNFEWLDHNGRCKPWNRDIGRLYDEAGRVVERRTCWGGGMETMGLWAGPNANAADDTLHGDGPGGGTSGGPGVGEAGGGSGEGSVGDGGNYENPPELLGLRSEFGTPDAADPAPRSGGPAAYRPAPGSPTGPGVGARTTSGDDQEDGSVLAAATVPPENGPGNGSRPSGASLAGSDAGTPSAPSVSDVERSGVPQDAPEAGPERTPAETASDPTGAVAAAGSSVQAPPAGPRTGNQQGNRAAAGIAPVVDPVVEDGQAFVDDLVSDATGPAWPVGDILGDVGYLIAGVLLAAGLVAACTLWTRRVGPIFGGHGRLHGKRPR